jgi:putative membrane protein
MSEAEKILPYSPPQLAGGGGPESTRAARAREHLANERTMLAWTRTSLTLIGIGFVVARFGLFLRTLEAAPSPEQSHVSVSAVIGIAVIVAGLVAAAISLVRFFRARRQIEEGRYQAEYWPEVLLMSMIGMIGVALVVYLAVNG